jgi:hypothetical protein
MPAQNHLDSARRHSVLKLDTGLRLVMAFIVPLVTSLSAHGQVVMACEQVFSATAREESAPYYDIALDRALSKSEGRIGDKEGLSAKDIEFLVNKVYHQEEGPRYSIKDYKDMTAQERTWKTLTRMVEEKITREGIISYFRDNGILLDHSTVLSKVKMFHHSPIKNVGSASLAVFRMSRGRLPIVIPNAFMKIKPDDMTVLLLRGLQSPEGREILQKYKKKQEFFRAYTLFDRYYTRIALSVVFILLWEKGDEFLKQKHDDVLKDLWTIIVDELKSRGGIS